MPGFIEENAQCQSTLFPELLNEYISPQQSRSVVDAFVKGLDLRGIGYSSELQERNRDAIEQVKDYCIMDHILTIITIILNYQSIIWPLNSRHHKMSFGQ